MLSPETAIGALALALGVALLGEARARSRPVRLGAILFLASLLAAYVGWRWSVALPAPALTPAALWAWLFLGLEMLALAYDAFSLFVLARLTDHSGEADALERELRGRGDLPSVDVFIPSYNERREVLGPAIASALALDYPAGRLRVYVLDDGRRDWVRELCQSCGAHYLSRPDNKGYKAGNLNNALRQTSGEIIAVIDADFVLRPAFLVRTVGFLLRHLDVGLVQTPQHFRNPDPVQHNLLGTRAWTEDQNFFMTLGQAGRDAHGNAFCVGSSFVVRRRCVEELGGFPAESVTEDIELSYALLGRGYRTLYLNEALSHGLAAESVTEYIKQRVRWMTGTLQQALLKTGPFRARGLRLIDRLFYGEVILYWLTMPFVAAGLLAPIVYWWTGVAPMVGGSADAPWVLFARLVCQALVMYWLSERKVMPVISTVNKAVAVFHLLAGMAKTCVRPFGAPFRVVDKGLTRDRVVVRWSVLWIFLLLAGLLTAGLAVNLTGLWEVVPVTAATAWAQLWSACSLLVLVLCAFVCVELPVPPGAPRPEDEVLHGDAALTARAVAARLLG